MRKKVIVTDRMQRGYVYWRTEPVGRNFAPGFTPDLTPKEMLRLGIFGGKYMTDCRQEFPRSWFARAKLCAERHGAPELFRCQRVSVARGLASQRLDPQARSARMVSVVLPLLHGPAKRGRRATDSTLACDAGLASRFENCHGRRIGAPAAFYTG